MDILEQVKEILARSAIMTTEERLKEKQNKLQALIKEFDQLTQQRQQVANEMLKLQGAVEALEEELKEEKPKA